MLFKDTENGTVAEKEAGKEEGALQFVPRKRTNTDHVITPRKPLRQISHNLPAQTQSVGSPKATVDKPSRRRKSTRKSIRKSTVVSLPEDATTSPFSLEIPGLKTTRDSVLPAFAINESSEIALDTMHDNESRGAENEPTLEKEAEPLSSIYHTTSSAAMIPLNDHGDGSEELNSGLRMEKLTTEDAQSIEEDRTEAGQSLEGQTEVLRTVEGEAIIETAHSAQVTETPKKRKAASLRKGTRQSTRNMRTSSVKAEDQNGEDIAASQNMESLSQPALCNSMDARTTLSEVVQPATVETSVTTGTQDLMGLTKRDASNQTVDAEVLAKEHSELPQMELPTQEVHSGTEYDDPADTETPGSPVPHAENGSADLELSTDLVMETGIDAEERIQTSESNAPESPTSLEHVEESTEETQAELATQIAEPVSSTDEAPPATPLPMQVSPNTEIELSPANSEEQTIEMLEVLEPIPIVPTGETSNTTDEPTEDLPGSSTPDPSTSELVETISENAPSVAYDHDETDMLRDFLSRVKANKAAKADKAPPKRKRSLPHSPLRLPLGDVDGNTSPSPQKAKDEFDVGPPPISPSKGRKKKNPVVDEEDVTEPKSIRRSGRTRLPVIKTPLGAPSLIPVRRLGQDADTTVTLRRSEEKELAALTRVNTRKNKGGALSAAEVLIKKAAEKEDPVHRQRLLKEAFDEKHKGKGKKGKSVTWAEELAQFQTMTGDAEKAKAKEKESGPEKKSAVRVGVRSKMALGMAVNGTPAPKRKMRGRS
jgi:hypothetical protein